MGKTGKKVPALDPDEIARLAAEIDRAMQADFLDPTMVQAVSAKMSSMSPEQPLASTGSSSAAQTLPPPKAPAEVMVPPPEAVPTQAIPVPKARAPAEVMVPPPAVVPSPAIPVPKARAPAEVMAPPPAVVPSPAIPVPKARAPEEVMAPAPDATPETKLGRRPATAAKSAPATDPRMVEAMCKNTSAVLIDGQIAHCDGGSCDLAVLTGAAPQARAPAIPAPPLPVPPALPPSSQPLFGPTINLDDSQEDVVMEQETVEFALPVPPFPAPIPKSVCPPPIGRSDSTMARSASFTDTGVDGRLFEALVPSASAASLHRVGMSLGHLDASSGAHVSQLHRAITLDRGLDVLAAQNLSMKPESVLRTKDDGPLPVLPESQQNLYKQYWRQFSKPRVEEQPIPAELAPAVAAPGEPAPASVPAKPAVAEPAPASEPPAAPEIPAEPAPASEPAAPPAIPAEPASEPAAAPAILAEPAQASPAAPAPASEPIAAPAIPAQPAHTSPAEPAPASEPAAPPAIPAEPAPASEPAAAPAILAEPAQASPAAPAPASEPIAAPAIPAQPAHTSPAAPAPASEPAARPAIPAEPAHTSPAAPAPTAGLAAQPSVPAEPAPAATAVPAPGISNEGDVAQLVQMLIAKLNISDDAGKVAALTALVAAKRGSEGLETPPAKRVAYTPSPSPPSLPHTAAPSTAPSTAPTAPSPASTAPSAPIPINSSTHPAEYGKFRRWIESNSKSAKELTKAWSAGGDVRLQAFQKYMQAGCNAGAVECFMRYQRSWEEEDRDSAVYVTFAELVEKHKGDQAAALELASKRRLEKDGTSKDRNSGQETFLWYGQQQKSWSTKKIDSIAAEIGLDPHVASELMETLTQPAPSHVVPSVPSRQRSSDSLPSEQPGMPPPPPPPTGEGEGERKPKRKPQPKPKGSDLECEVLPADDLATFCATWIKKASDAQGISASICAQLEEFESQEKLAGLIRDSADGLSQHRKEMIGLGPNLRLDQVNSVLEKAKLYVLNYKKHIKTAQNLIAAAKREALQASGKAKSRTKKAKTE